MMITRNFIGVVVLCLCALAACTSSKSRKDADCPFMECMAWRSFKTYSGKGCEGTIDILKKVRLMWS